MLVPQRDMLLSTAQVADLLGVSPATVKRWAEAGVLPSERTPGGHRRFRRADLERVDRQGERAALSPLSLEDWLSPLLSPGSSLVLDGALLETRGQLGSWFAVAEALGPVIEELGCRWERGAITPLEEHVASARLGRALARAAEGVPVARAAPRVLLATPPGEQHALGLSLADPCFREAGRATVWAGADVPLSDLTRWAAERAVEVVALSASVVAPAALLADVAQRLAPACAAAGVALILGGRGAWPDPSPPGGGELVRTWTALRGWLLRHAPWPAPRCPAG